jgi:SAM-dependent methyltransferase
MKIFRLGSLDEYRAHVERNQTNYAFMRQYESQAGARDDREFTIKGISYPANQYVDFKVDYLFSNGRDINWRERLICPVTGLNNRLRCSVHILDFELSPYPESSIYITEQVTPLFSLLSKRFPRIIGSEYLGNDFQAGIIQNNIRHEDMTGLSFETESMDYYLSFECFEHIPAYEKAIPEIYRVLKPGGVFLGTFPFDTNKYNNLIKAKLDKKGNIIYLTEPEYHGDPVGGKGILCYTVFGWEILDEFRKNGFTNVYAIFIWSDVYGYLGGEQIFFIAKKPNSKNS